MLRSGGIAMGQEDFLLKQLNKIFKASVNRSQGQVLLRKNAVDISAQGDCCLAQQLLDDALELCCGLTPNLFQSFSGATIASVLSVNSDKYQLLEAVNIFRDKSTIYLKMGEVDLAAKANQVASKLLGASDD
jgi:hypothetical protein